MSPSLRPTLRPPRCVGTSTELRQSAPHSLENEFRVTLENTIRDELGQRSGGGNWLEYQVEGATKSPVLVFRYPAVIPPEAGASYIEQSVKMELGSLINQRPVGRHRIAPLIAEIVAEGAFEDFSGEVVALEVERTFWEKATILHAEFHLPETQALKDRMARHYADFADLWKHPASVPARAQFDLARVVAFKSRYYPSKWARYDLARPGTLRLCPPAARKPELAEDYRRMAVMYFQGPLSFLEILTTLQQAETEINSRKQLLRPISDLIGWCRRKDFRAEPAPCSITRLPPGS
jgi:hypothetical protein